MKNQINYERFIRIKPLKHTIFEHFKGGVLLSIPLLPKQQNIILKLLCWLAPQLFYKDIYFWLPYQTSVDVNNYGTHGPKSRSPYSNIWFQLKETHLLYELTAKKLEFLVLTNSVKTFKLKLALCFMPNSLIKVTSKPLKKILDSLIIKKQ